MKKGYIKIFFFELLMSIIFIINALFYNFLLDYIFILILFLGIFLFYIIFGFEKDKHSNLKNTIIYIFIYIILYFILYYIIGLLTGYYYSKNYYTIYGLINFILPIILTIFASEFLKYQLLQKSEGSIFLIIFTTLLFILINISNTIYYLKFNSGYDFFVFLGLYLFPSISRNVCTTFVSIKSGYKPSIVLMLVIELYQYLLPIIPNFNEYFKSIFEILYPTIITFVLAKLYEDRLDVNIEYKKRNYTISFLGMLVCSFVVYFTSGYFKYQSIAIASGSMRPTFNRGDVVIVKKINDNYENINIGDVIAYNYENKLVVHRVVKIINIDEELYFYTKGDANEEMDNYKITTDMILGTTNVYIPFIGYPTILLSEL